MTRGLKLDKKGGLALSEDDVTAQVIGRLAADGWTCLKLDCGWDANLRRVYGEPGMCDWAILKRSLWPNRPHLTFLELKKPYATPEPHQLAWMDGMRKRGFHCDWVDSYKDGGKRPLLSVYGRGQFYLTPDPGPGVV